METGLTIGFIASSLGWFQLRWQDFCVFSLQYVWEKILWRKMCCMYIAQWLRKYVRKAVRCNVCSHPFGFRDSIHCSWRLSMLVLGNLLCSHLWHICGWPQMGVMTPLRIKCHFSCTFDCLTCTVPADLTGREIRITFQSSEQSQNSCH